MQKDGVVSMSALDDAEKEYRLAVNKQSVARAQMTVLQAKIAQTQAQVAQDEASLKQFEEQLSYTDIVSPIDGIVLSRDVEMGDAVSSILVLGSSATLVMTLGDTSQVYVKGKVDESDIGRVYLGQPARIKVESFKDKTFNGVVTKISPMGVAGLTAEGFDDGRADVPAGAAGPVERVVCPHAGSAGLPLRLRSVE